MKNISFKTKRAQDFGGQAALNAIARTKADSLRKLFIKGLDINRMDDNNQRLVDCMVSERNDSIAMNGLFDGEPECEVSHELMGRMILGQLPNPVPEDLPGAEEHKKFFTLKSSEEFDSWLLDNVKNSIDASVPPVLLSAGTKMQLLRAAQLLYERQKMGKKVQAQSLTTICLGLLKQAILVANNEGIYNLLALCAQLGAIERDGSGNLVVSKVAKSPIEATSDLGAVSAAYLPFYDKRLFYVAFASLFTQLNLYKIVSKDKENYGDDKNGNRQKALKNIQDLKITFDRHWMDTRKNLAKEN